jgi:HK97 gp10 family phage protein
VPDQAVTINWSGFDGIRATLQKLPVETQTKVMAVALKRAAAPVVRVAKALAPKRTGALRSSITSIVKKGRNGNSYAVIGPARGRFSGGKRIGAKDSAAAADMPANYAHLVEFGHHAVRPVKGAMRRKGTASGIRFVPAKPFMRPALISSKGASFAALAEGVAEGIDKALQRLGKNSAARG